MQTFEIKPPINKTIPQHPSIYTYNKIKGRSGDIWYYKDGKFAGDYIYVSNNDKSGFYGHIICFKLVNGKVDEIVGPWHSNSETLFADTGINLTNKHATFIVLAKTKHDNVLNDIIYTDEFFIESEFNRYKILAEYYSKLCNCDIYYYQEYSGGKIVGKIDKETIYAKD